MAAEESNAGDDDGIRAEATRRREALLTGTARPVSAFNPDGIPDELRAVARWVLWAWEPKDGGRWSKVPKSADGRNAAADKPKTWCAFDAALAALRASPGRFDGLGFVLGDGWAGVDLDNCLVTAGSAEPAVTEWAWSIARELDSYTEISPTGTGLKVIVKYDLLPALAAVGKRFSYTHEAAEGEAEFIASNKFFTVTGTAMPFCPPFVFENGAALESLVKLYLPGKAKPAPPQQAPAPARTSPFGVSEGMSAVERCRRYLRPVESSVQGQRGSNAVFKVARIIWQGFALDFADGYPLLQEYNQRSVPAWPEEGSQGLRRKWDEAARPRPGDTKPRGHLLNENRPGYGGTNGKCAPFTGRSIGAQPASVTGTGAQSATGNPPPVRLSTRRISEVQTSCVEWLWRGWLPAGMLAILDGDPSQGKSLITLDIAARLSRGLPMPFCTEAGAPVNTLLLAAEDAVEHTIAPRVHAAGADANRIIVSDTVLIGEHERPIRMPEDFSALEREIVATESKLLVIDPLLGFLSQAVDSHKDQSVRDVLHQLKLIAERTGCAVLGLRHLTKGSAGANPMYRGGGSIAITAAARSAFTVAPHPTEDDANVMATTKLNLMRNPQSLVYRVRDHMGLPVVDWLGECDLTAADVGATAPRGNGTALDTAVEFLRDLLQQGRPVKVDDVHEKAKAAQISESTLKRAKAQLKVIARKLRFAGEWVWELPNHEGGQAPNDTEGDQIPA